MATYYSDIFTGLGRTTAGTPAGSGGATASNIKQTASNAHARTRTAVGHFRVDADEDLDDGDIIHMMMLKPTDRLLRLQLTCDDFGTAGTLDIGTYTVSQSNGALAFTVDDEDLFASDLDVNAAALTWSDVMHESTTVPIEYIGRPMWELANLGAGTWTAATATDNFAISVTGETASSTADDLDIILVATYISGD